MGVFQDAYNQQNPQTPQSSGNLFQQAQQNQQNQMGVLPKPDFLQQAGDVVNSIFPGKEVGQAIGTLGGYVASGFNKNYDTSAPSPIQVGGDIAQGALTVAAPEIGKGATVAGRIGANAALGAGIGASGAVADNKGLTDTVKSTAIGGALGGGISATGEMGSYLSKNLPNWFTKLALPKLGSELKGTPQETIDYALNNTKGATLKTMYANSKQAIGSYENQVQAVLNHPQYANEVGNIGNGMKSIQEAFPNAGLTNNKVGSILKQVAPQNQTLVDKVVKGTANLGEQNTLRKELDQATKKAYGDKPTLTFAKSIGKSMADFLRGNVQGTAKETIPIFSEYSKEHTLNNALGSALSKKRVAGPLVAGGAGFAHSGVTGALEGIAIEEGLRSPTTKLLAGKAIQGISKVATPVAETAMKAVKAPLIKKLSQ